MVKKNWRHGDIVSQTSKIAIVTGATSGLGYETAIGLAGAGATVIIAGRNDKKGQHAVDRIKVAVSSADVVFEKVDFASLSSVKEFCDRFLSRHEVLDILVNNAGTVGAPKRETTMDGLELHLETNYLTHFALTAQLLPALRKSNDPRVVHVSSFLHFFGSIKFKDLQLEKSNYSAFNAYCQSKLAILLFMKELQKRSNEEEWGLKSIGVHPGYARTNIMPNGTGYDFRTTVMQIYNRCFNSFLSQSAANGALPSLYAATAPEAKPGKFYGPKYLLGVKGPPVLRRLSHKINSRKNAEKLWDISVNLSGVTWPHKN